MFTNRTSGRYVTEDREMIGKVREQIAGERITEFLSGMSQLGFTEQGHCGASGETQWGGEEQWITTNWLSVKGLTKTTAKDRAQ